MGPDSVGIERIIRENRAILGDPTLVKILMDNPTFWRRFFMQTLPQGHLSGLDADTVDGLHANDFLRRISEVAKSGGGGGGSESGGVSKHTDLTDKEVVGVIDHADLSVTMAKLVTEVQTLINGALQASDHDLAHHVLGENVPHDNLYDLSEKSHTSLDDKEDEDGIIDHTDQSITPEKLLSYNSPSSGQIPRYFPSNGSPGYFYWSDYPSIPTTYPSLISAAFVGTSFILVKTLSAGSHTIQVQWTRQVPDLGDWYITCRPDLPDPYHGFEHMRLIVSYGTILLQHALETSATSSEGVMTWEDVVEYPDDVETPMALTFTLAIETTVLIMLSTACTLTSSATFASRAALLLRLVLDDTPLEGSECFGRSGFYGNALSYPDGST